MSERRLTGFQILANASMAIWTIIIVLPFILLFTSSITEENTLVSSGYSFLPRELSMNAYLYILRSGEKIVRAYGVSVLATLVGTLAHITLSALMAYPLTVRHLPGRKALMFFVFFTMLFNGGIVPSYIVWGGTFHIKDTIWAQILPNLLLSGWTVMMIRTYFQTSIPDSLYEAARIDGASEMRIFLTIIPHLGKPILVTMGTFAGLAYWNNWTNGLYFIAKEKNLYNVQNLLNQMISDVRYLAQSSDSNVAAAASALPATGIQMAIAFVAILPIMLIFPAFQRFYAKGITLGGVKG